MAEDCITWLPQLLQELIEKHKLSNNLKDIFLETFKRLDERLRARDYAEFQGTCVYVCVCNEGQK